MHQWVYVSKYNILAADEQQVVQDIVQVAQSRNASLGVTGALLFTGTHFAQMLEGPASSIMALRSSILVDPRHGGVMTMREGKISVRRLAGWSLAYSGPSLLVSRAVQRCIRNSAGDRQKAGVSLTDLMVEIVVQA